MSSEADFADFAASSTDLTAFPGASSRTSSRSHNRTMSALVHGVPSSRHNRLSVHFPMQLPTLPEQTHSDKTESSRATSALPVDGSFLTALAAQERRVLELKEELQRAETELNRLKNQWAKHDEEQKRAGLLEDEQSEKLMTEKLLTIQTTCLPPHEDLSETTSARAQQDISRQRAFASSSTRSSGRTVFSGSRHTRALSLLSAPSELPDSAAATPAAVRPPRRESLFVPKKVTAYKAPRDLNASQDPALDLGMHILDNAIDHEMLIRTGKKFATELKDGLWTFWEDIRQATVGEEATQPQLPPRKNSTQSLRAPRKQGSRNSLRSSSRGSSGASKATIDASRGSPLKTNAIPALPDLATSTFWVDSNPPSPNVHAISEGASAPDPDPVISKEPQTTLEDDAWDTWDDSPVQSRHSSYATSEANTAPSTVSDSPRTSTSTNAETKENAQPESVPSWSALSKMGPASLRNTASTLIKEWDKL